MTPPTIEEYAAFIALRQSKDFSVFMKWIETSVNQLYSQLVYATGDADIYRSQGGSQQLLDIINKVGNAAVMAESERSAVKNSETEGASAFT